MPKQRVVRHAVRQPRDVSYRFIPLTKKQNAIVDAADFAYLSQWNWRAQWNTFTESFYAVRHEHPKNTVLMHRVILGCEPEEEGDHKDRNSLDNRRNNLRKCSKSQNMQNRGPQYNNSSGFKGVTWNKAIAKWHSRIMVAKHSIHLGFFQDVIEAARAYDRAAALHHGEFAFLNFENHRSAP